MRRLRFALFFFLFAGSSILPVAAQFGRNNSDKGPNFFYQIANFPGREASESRLFIFVSVPYDELVFVRADSGFAAHYKFGVYLYDRKGKNLLFEKNWQRTISVSTYQETNQRGVFDRFVTSFAQKPGKYRLFLRLKDRQVPRPRTLKKEVTVRNFLLPPLQVSSLLATDARADSCMPGKLPEPDPTKNFVRNFFVRFEAVKQNDGDVSLLFEVFGRHSRTLFQADTLFFPSARKRACFQVAVNVDSLRNGRYRARVRPLNIKGVQAAETDFRVVKAMEFRSERELDDAIAVLRYIAQPEEWDKIEKAETFQEKKKLFDAFWKNLDPTPDTEFNELQAEFYERVAYANEHFSLTGDDGWRTDRGRIYIIYGPPDDVEHQTDQQFQEYEIWRYTNLNKEFVFWDRNGSGDYELVRSQ